MVIVQGVIRPDLDQQYVVLEESFVGTVTYEVAVDASIPTEGSPETPLEGALVTVANLDLPSDSCGNPVVFLEDPPTSSLPRLAGVCWGPTSCPTGRGCSYQSRPSTAPLLPEGRDSQGWTEQSCQWEGIPCRLGLTA